MEQNYPIPQDPRPKAQAPGRKRKKKGRNSIKVNTKNECFREEKVRVSLSHKGERLIPSQIPNHPVSNGLVRFKISERWHNEQLNKKLYAIPYIDQRGFVHSQILAFWKCTSTQLFATVVSTVHKRLWSINAKKAKSYSGKRISSDLIYKIALIYVLSFDNYWLKRSLALIERGRSPVRHVFWKLSKLDANKRFLYDQSQNSVALWFQSRTATVKVCSHEHRPPRVSILPATEVSPAVPRVSLESHSGGRVRNIFDLWGDNYVIPKEEINQLKINSGVSLKSSSLFVG